MEEKKTQKLKLRKQKTGKQTDKKTFIIQLFSSNKMHTVCTCQYKLSNWLLLILILNCFIAEVLSRYLQAAQIANTNNW